MAKSSLTGLASRTFGILPGFVPGKRRCRTRIPPVELLDLGAQPRILSEQLPDQFEQLFVIQLRGIEIEVHCASNLKSTGGFGKTSPLINYLFTLFSLKAGLTYDLPGLVCGMDPANAKRNQQLGLHVLEATIAAVNCLPQRAFKDAAEFAEYLKNEATLIFDGVEQSTQRPSDDVARKDNYSGKKSATRRKL